MIPSELQVTLRRVSRSAKFSALVVTLLAIGIGGTASIFSLLSAIYFRPLPYPDADRLALVSMNLQDPACTRRCLRDPSKDDVQNWRDRMLPAVTAIGTLSPTQVVAQARDGARVLEGAVVSAEIPVMLHSTASLGRSLASFDFAPSASPVVVLTNSTWRERFGSDPSIVNSAMTLSGTTYTVVGVLDASSELGPPLFGFNAPKAQFLVPASATSSVRSSSINKVLVKLSPSASITQMQAQLTASMLRDDSAPQIAAAKWGVKTTSLRDAFSERYKSSLWYLFGAAAALLLISCLNVSGLFLARLNQRASEFATRTALGATRLRLIGQVLSEVGVLVLIGGSMGILLTFYGITLVQQLPTLKLPFWTQVTMDVRVVGATVTLMLACICVVSLAPFTLLSQARLLRNVRSTTSASRNRGRMRVALVSSQVALSLVLLAVAATLTATLVRAELRDLGSTKRDMLYVQLESRISGPAAVTLTRRLLQDVAALPSVRSVGALGFTDLARSRNGGNAIEVEGQSAAQSPPMPLGESTDVSADYFDAMGVKLVAGRAFAESDSRGALPVAILDEATASRLFQKASAVGRRIRMPIGESGADWVTIVGVSATVRAPSLVEDTTEFRPTVYRPLLQTDAMPGSLLIGLRSSARNSVRDDLRRVIASVDASLPISNILSVEESIGARLFTARFNVRVLISLAILALALSSIGTYAALSYAMTAQQRELAIRIALGANRQSIASVVFRSSATILGIGITTGLFLVFAATRILAGLFGATEPVGTSAIVVSVTCLAFATLLASALPARRAASTDPALLLRES